MDSLLAPAITNNKSKFYLKYVDDILAVFDKEQDSLNFLDFKIESILTLTLR